MKIAILTLPLHTNFGGILQAYALQTVLERMGHNVTVITRDKRVPITARLIFLSIPKRILCRLCGRTVSVFRELRWNQIYIKISKNITPFIDKYIKQDNRLLERIKPSDYDAIVVGSDQIWRQQYIHNTLRSSVNNAYLGFAKSWNIIRVAYSASFGTDTWEYCEKDTEFIKSSLIGLFKAVSVRESSGVELCRDYFGINAELLIDPTLLLSLNDYVKLIDCSYTNPSDGNLFHYFLDSTADKTALVGKIAEEKQLTPFTNVARPEDRSALLSERVQPPLEQWLRSFMDAEFVVTDSFHGCVFSILFHKPFVVVGNSERGLSRFESLLKMFNLMNHLLLDIQDYVSSYSYEIPEETYSVLDQERKRSFQFLNENLS